MIENTNLPEALEARVRSELRDGERLVWTGQPRPGLMARQALPIVIFGAVWTAFSVGGLAFTLWMFSGFAKSGGSLLFAAVFPLSASFAVLIGVALLSTPFWLRRMAKRTFYALTDRRAILWVAGWFQGVEVRSYAPKDLTGLRRVEQNDGAGDLVLEELVTNTRDGDGNPTTITKRYGFVSIDNAREVEALLRKTLPVDA